MDGKSASADTVKDKKLAEPSTRTSSSTSKSGTKKQKKFNLQKIDDLRDYSGKAIFSYIENLHKSLKKKEKKIKKYKEKIKKLTKKVSHLQDVRVPPDAKTSTEAVAKAKQDHKEQEAIKEPEETPLSLADEIRQAAEAAQNENGFIYEPTSGLYYDQKTGYYYNAEYGLYYDGNNGCYYKYNQEKNEFEFHSQVEVTNGDTADKVHDNHIFDNYNMDDANGDLEEWGVGVQQRRKTKLKSPREKVKKVSSSSSALRKEKRKSTKRKHSHLKSLENSNESGSENDNTDRDKEDGELPSSSTSNSSDGEDAMTLSTDHYQDIAKQYPPSMRIIVQETNLDKLQVGTLRLITFKGGTLGREGSHDVVIPDVNVSKYHLKFTYDTEEATYKCIDLGSRNGTILNGTRMSNALQESEPLNLVHGSVIQVSQTKLLCHIHSGNSTCGQCEPGLLMEPTPTSVVVNCPSVALTHKEQLKKLQKKYGLENERFIEGKQLASGYNDRAATRRIKVGSSTATEKTQTSSVNTEISSENKGFKMLAKLGWNKGEALGKTNSSGLLEPINISSNEGKKGLGCDDQGLVTTAALTKVQKHKIKIWKKTQDRYSKSVQPDDIFNGIDDDGLPL